MYQPWQIVIHIVHQRMKGISNLHNFWLVCVPYCKSLSTTIDPIEHYQSLSIILNYRSPSLSTTIIDHHEPFLAVPSMLAQSHHACPKSPWSFILIHQINILITMSTNYWVHVNNQLPTNSWLLLYIDYLLSSTIFEYWLYMVIPIMNQPFIINQHF